MADTALSAEAKKITDAVTFRNAEWKGNFFSAETFGLTDEAYITAQCRHISGAAGMQAGGQLC